MDLRKKDWSIADISRQVHALARECASPYNDGFTSFELKKELHLLKEIVDQAFETAPDFGELEQKWLTEQEKKRIIKILKS